MNTREKTLSMRLDHIFFELSSLAVELRYSAKKTQAMKYYTFFADFLEKKIEVWKKDIEKINYVEID